ncbi:NACHT domain-containing protein [Streptomyces hydrogenans]|uniref:NACHT domain-containing protein n=1 Tax=Streptomyces hydrogenans TaxID=1873719 RepID=UPI00364CA7E6
MIAADEPLWKAFVTVLADDGRIIGGGVYTHCGDRDRPALLTCAHVVNLALGRGEFTMEPPGTSDVTLEFPAFPGVYVKAGVRRWWPATGLNDPGAPPVTGRDGRWAADVAELEPRSPLPVELEPVPLAVPALGDEVWAWRGNGDPRTVVRLRANAPAGEWLVLEAPPTGFAVQPGYSGGPLWDRRRGAVVGLMVSAHERVAYTSMTTAVPFRQCYGIRGDVLRERLLGKQDARAHLDPRIWPLLKAQRQAAASFPYRSIGLHRDDLTRVYVRQQLAPGSERQGRPHTVEEVAEADNEHPPRTVEDFLARFRHVLVVGPPGAGKSTLTLQLAAELVPVPSRRQDDATQLVPIRVSARELASRPEVELSTAIWAAARASVSSRFHLDIGEDLCVLPPRGLAWLFIIDGLDEVQDATMRADLSDRLRRFMAAKTKHRILLTTRQLPARERARWEASRDLGRCEIEPFERGQRRDFVQKWFREQPKLADDFLGQITSARLEEVVSVPLLATVAAIVFEEQAGQPLPRTAFALYQRFVSHLYESRLEQLTANLRERLAGWAEADHVRERLITGRIDLIEHCAAVWLRGEDVLSAALEWLRKADSQPYPQPTDWPDVVATVLTSTGLVIHDGPALTFVHRSFAEHLAAAEAARRLPSRFNADDPRWWHTLRGALSGGRPQDQEAVLHRALLSDVDGLLDWLLAGDDDARELGARLIFEGVPSTPAHHEALTETLGYWASQVHRPWGPEQLVRVLNAIRTAPAPVVDLLVDMLDASHHPLEVRDAAIRALLRAGSSTSDAVQALIAITNERPLTGLQRVRAAEMLMDLGPEARAAARVGLLRIANERDWVTSEVRARAAELVEEIGTATSSQALQKAPVNGNGTKFGGSDAWRHSTLLPEQRAAPLTGPVLVPSDMLIYSDQAVSAGWEAREVEGSAALLPPGTTASSTRKGEAGSLRHVLYPRVRIALGLPEDTLDVTATAAAVYDALQATLIQPGPSGRGWKLARQSGVALHMESNAAGQERSDPVLTEEQWDAVARWLCAHPEAHLAAMDDMVFDIDALAVTRPGRLHAIAAALIHGPQPAARQAHELLARRIQFDTSTLAPLQLLRIAAESAQRPADLKAIEPVVDVICARLQLSEPRFTTAHASTAQVMGSGPFITRLISDRSVDPRGTISALLALGRESLPMAIRFLAERVGDQRVGFSEWCAAVRLLKRLPEATAPVIRLTREVLERTHIEDRILELCRVLIDFSANDLATEHLLELAQDGSARPDKRRRAIELLPHSEGRESLADRAHAVIEELTSIASPAERVALASTQRTISPQASRSATALILSTLDDKELPSESRRQALALLAVIGPDVRRKLVVHLEKLFAHPAEPDAEQLKTLRQVAQWGPDLHRAAQAIWERLAQRRTGAARVAMAAELHRWGWISESRSSRLLVRIAQSVTEDPYVRVAAANALLRHGTTMAHASGEVLHQLVHESRVEPTLALQSARDLAAAGGLLEARRVLSELIGNAEVADSHRYKAATLLLMVDLTCGPDTLATLRDMAGDRSLSESTRNWAAFAADCARDGIHESEDPLPDSWLHS